LRPFALEDFEAFDFLGGALLRLRPAAKFTGEITSKVRINSKNILLACWGIFIPGSLSLWQSLSLAAQIKLHILTEAGGADS
jgi:hypothetical protein